MASEKIELSLIVALYNEADRFGPVSKSLLEYLHQSENSWELVLIDDGSTDKTPHLLENFGRKDSRIRILRFEKNRGQGAAIKAGMMAACGRVLVYADGDLAAPLDQLAMLKAAIDAGYDVAVGSRWLSEFSVRRQQPFLRRVLGRLFYRLIHIFFPLDLADVNCGLKAYRREVARLIFGITLSRRWGFNLEHLLAVRMGGFKIKEVPVSWRHKGKSKVHIFRDVFYTLWEISVIFWRLKKGAYR